MDGGLREIITENSPVYSQPDSGRVIEGSLRPEGRRASARPGRPNKRLDKTRFVCYMRSLLMVILSPTGGGKRGKRVKTYGQRLVAIRSRRRPSHHESVFPIPAKSGSWLVIQIQGDKFSKSGAKLVSRLESTSDEFSYKADYMSLSNNLSGSPARKGATRS